jgi:hypothetical protein
MTGTTAVLVWGGFNSMLATILAGFTASGFIGGAGPAGALAFILYGSAATGVFIIALLVWAGKRRRTGLRVPPRPVAAVLLATAIALAWLSLALGPWPVMVASAPFVAAIVAEFYPRDHP